MDRNRNALYMCWSVYWIVLIHSSCSDTTCNLPSGLQNSDWTYRYPSGSFNVSITTNRISSSSTWINAQGDNLNLFDCFTSKSISSSEELVVLKSSSSYSDEGNTRYVYMCMKMTKVTNDLYYFYLLADIDNSVSPAERIYTPSHTVTHSASDPVCNTFCNYTTKPPDNDVRTFSKGSSNGNLTTGIKLCEPCEQSCTGNSGQNVCPDLEVVEHATNETTGNEPGDSITYTCETGYEITSGSPIRTCQNNQTWNGTAPACSAVSCPTLATVAHSSKQQNGTSYTDTVTYTCNSGYERSSGSSQRTCKNDKKWSGSQPVCKKTETSTLSLKETNVVVGATLGGCFVLFVFAACCIAFCVLRRKKKRKLKNATKRKKQQRMDKGDIRDIQFY